jgi:hypothetical protein
MALLKAVRPLDGKFVKAYWQKTKDDKEMSSLVVADGDMRRVMCSYDNQINLADIGGIDFVINGKVLDLCTTYDIKLRDWIFIEGKKYIVESILMKRPYQESNMYSKNSALVEMKIAIR